MKNAKRRKSRGETRRDKAGVTYTERVRTSSRARAVPQLHEADTTPLGVVWSRALGHGIRPWPRHGAACLAVLTMEGMS